MVLEKSETVAVEGPQDVVLARHRVRQWAVEAGFSLVDQTKLVTAASELARNVVSYGGGGTMYLELLNDGPRRGLRMTFQDAGPGIPDVDLAMSDGYSTSGGLGMGLPGAKRLSSEFSIESEVGKGTRVVATRWMLR